mgnify:CR=1 FL=1
MIDVLIIQLSYVVTHLPFLYSLLLRCVVSIFHLPCNRFSKFNFNDYSDRSMQCIIYFSSRIIQSLHP